MITVQDWSRETDLGPMCDDLMEGGLCVTILTDAVWHRLSLVGENDTVICLKWPER